MHKKLIWDLPTRLFHWSLALSFAGAWLTSESDPWLSVHVFLGYLMLGLLGFRVLWGLVGTQYARFASFWYSPTEAWNYLRAVLSGTADRHIGHNPTGSLAIYLLLLLGLVVCLSGVFTLGGEEQHGAVAGWLAFSQGKALKALHEGAAIAMLVLVLVHLAGVVVESWLHRENLARSMLTGAKLAPPSQPEVTSRRPVAAVMLVLMIAFAAWWFHYALSVPIEQRLGSLASSLSTRTLPFVGPRLADHPQWREECSSCHIAYHPSLLPSRSWRALMAGQNQHFGADLALDAATASTITTFLTTQAAERQQTEAATKILQSVPAEAVPRRITETPYWVRKHREIADADWQSSAVKSKANCAACHLDAEQGTFEDAAMRIPARPAST